MATFYSPLRYPGGKSRLTNFIKLVLQLNKLEGGTYVEPFAGGAGIALGLLVEEKVSNIFINDIDPAIFAFWFSVLNHTDQLCEKIITTPVNIENWYQQRTIFNAADSTNALELGFATFFLNRTNRSGILSAGVIGGLNQTGDWKIDARFNKDKLIGLIQKIAALKSNITLTNLDARVFLEKYKGDFGTQALAYLDPPYFHKGQKLYLNSLKPDDHILIAHAVLNNIQIPWIVSYDNTPEICGLYESNRQSTHPLNYTAANRYHGSEVIIYSDELLLPKAVENPFILPNDSYKRAIKKLDIFPK